MFDRPGSAGLERLGNYLPRPSVKRIPSHTDVEAAVDGLLLPMALDLWTVRKDVKAWESLAFAMRAWFLYLPFVVDEPTAARSEGLLRDRQPFYDMLPEIRSETSRALVLWLAHSLGLDMMTLIYVAHRVDTLAREHYGVRNAAYRLALSSMMPGRLNLETTWKKLKDR